jgi:hypothetical protein
MGEHGLLSIYSAFCLCNIVKHQKPCGDQSVFRYDQWLETDNNTAILEDILITMMMDIHAKELKFLIL